MPERTYGEIDGFPPGSTFTSREDLAATGVHRPLQAGICGGRDGAESIVVSGGYPDDEDFGDELIYTGQGGLKGRKQVKDQELKSGNIGLARSAIEGYPVRVIRGEGGDTSYSPAKGLRYDGLYRVVDFWHETRNRRRIWRFRLVAEDEQGLDRTEPGRPTPTARRATTIQRIVRSTAKAQRVKLIHRHQCQVCDLAISTPTGDYAEAAHIKALGKPHNGPDEESNILCLCPNHHVMFDAGAIYIDEVWMVWDSANDQPIRELRRHGRHKINRTYVEYHRKHHALSRAQGA
ncbi:YDG/SRA domain-containing protein [Actinoplanes subtropicus]|uniref:YDG/SRA domain-containing protein n=1 Tax=Actinoplanes subtropicus TaxID=543632 RepID=UPI000550B826|nr:YDG/SRA domain-containing protein [Actinoplanes subtropicus]